MAGSEYAALKSSTNSLRKASKAIIARAEGINEYQYPRLFADFYDALSELKSLPVSGEITDLRKLYEAAELAKGKDSFWDPDEKFRNAAGAIDMYSDSVLAKADIISRRLRTPNLEKREALVQLVGNCSRTVSGALEKIKAYTGDEDGLVAWIGLKPTQIELVGALSGIERTDSELGMEWSYLSAMGKLTYEGSSTDLDFQVAEKKRDKFVSALEDVAAFIGTVKVDYNIADSDIEKPENVRALEEELSVAYRRIGELARLKDASGRVEIVPKHGETLEKLGKLQENLFGYIGSNEQAFEVNSAIEDSIINLEKIILLGHDSDRVLTPQERAILTHSYKMKETLGVLEGDATLDETHKKLLKNYSFELLAFIKSRERVWHIRA